MLAACQTAPNILSNNSETFTGFLIGETVDVSAEVGGRVANVAVQEGARVQAGQVLMTLDDEIVKLRVEIADAQVSAAQAQVALLEAGARSEEMNRAQARVEQARAARDLAAQAFADAEAIRARPQALLIAHAQAELRAQIAQEQLLAAAHQAQAADLEHALWEEQVRAMWAGVDVTLPGGQVLHFDTPTQKLDFAQREWNQAGNRAWQAWGAVEQAKANADAATAARQDIADQLANPIALDARVNQARAVRDRADAALASAQAGLQILREGASPSQVQAARAALDQARAARAALDQEINRHQIVAPRAGTITRVFNRAGETIAPTAPLARLSVAGDLKLRVFVPMTTIAQIKLNDSATIALDDSNNRTVSGAVSFIAERAEFSGRQAQTDDERNAQLVTVEIAIKNADGQLKAGMPASIAFGATPPNKITLPALIRADAPRTFSGTLEAKQTRLAPELGGKVIAVRAQRAEVVQAGATLVELDDTTARANILEAESAARAAQANLDQQNEKARAGTVALADAAIAQAQAELDAAKTTLRDAERALASPQDIVAQIHAAESRVAGAKGEITRAQAGIALAQDLVESAKRDLSMAGKYRLAIMQRQLEAADANLRAAKINANGSERVLGLSRELQTNPLELKANRNAAANQVKQAQAGLNAAQVERAIAQRAGQPEAIALAEAKSRAAQASLKLMQAQANRLVIHAPLNGTIIARSVEVGETVRAGAPLLTIADTRALELTVYVPMQFIGAAQIGQGAQIKTPSVPGKIFAGKIIFIATESEFKPANIYNAQERSEMVFAVRVLVQNPDGILKAGLPADATWQ